MSGEVVEGSGDVGENTEAPEEVEVDTNAEGTETDTEEGGETDEESEEDADDDEGSGEDDEEVDDSGGLEEEEGEGEQKSYKKEFKEHPELRKAFFEHKQYSQIFSSPAEAAEAYEEVQTFRDLSSAVDAGDVNPVIQSIIEANPQAFEKFAVDFIPNVQGMDQNLYKKVVAPIFSDLLKNAANAAKQNGNKSLYLATQWMSNWIFGTAEPPNIQRVQPQPQNGNNGARRDIQARQSDFFGELGEEINSFLSSEAERNLDPNKVLPSALLKSTKSEIIAEAVAIIKKDVGAQNRLKVLRDQAARAGFDYASRKRIRDAYSTMMKPIIAQKRAEKRNEAMKAIGKSVDIKNKLKKKVIPSASKMGATKRPVDGKDVDWMKTSPRDAMDGKFVMKTVAK